MWISIKKNNFFLFLLSSPLLYKLIPQNCALQFNTCSALSSHLPQFHPQFYFLSPLIKSVLPYLLPSSVSIIHETQLFFFFSDWSYFCKLIVFYATLYDSFINFIWVCVNFREGITGLVFVLILIHYDVCLIEFTWVLLQDRGVYFLKCEIVSVFFYCFFLYS